MFAFNMFPHNIGGPFKETYRCYSVSMMPGHERQEVEEGGKIMMPPSALDKLANLQIQYPMLFKLTNTVTNRSMHCGVLEFVAEEGRIHIPYWMMRNLLLDEGSLLAVENVSLPVATFAKFQPQSTDFLDITNPKAVLENSLRNFACLTTGDVIAIKYNQKVYEMCVLETKPGEAVTIIECDMNVDFAPPVGYQDPAETRQAAVPEEPMAIDGAEFAANQFRAFCGQGNRLDGKTKNTESPNGALLPHEIKRGIPNYDYKKGMINFIRTPRPVNGLIQEKEAKAKVEAFSGIGQSLRKNNTRK